jgi:hypothetical protein
MPVRWRDYTASYRAAGFTVLDQTVRHQGGLQTGFVQFGPEYIEFLWVDDESLFAEADEERSLDDWLHERTLLTGETLVACT